MKTPTRKKVFDIVGEARETKGGLSRQSILVAAEAGDPVSLRREANNPADANAVLVLIGEHDIGYLAREDAALIAPALDNGLFHKAQLHQVTGGVAEAKHYGARIAIAWGDQNLPPCRPRDERQEVEREKRAKGLEPESTGCLVLIALIGVPFAATATAISQLI